MLAAGLFQGNGGLRRPGHAPLVGVVAEPITSVAESCSGHDAAAAVGGGVPSPLRLAAQKAAEAVTGGIVKLLAGQIFCNLLCNSAYRIKDGVESAWENCHAAVPQGRAKLLKEVTI